jgi:hypothetical protein
MTKGDHLFNHLVKAIENMKDAVIEEMRKIYPQATKAIFDRAYRAHIGDIQTHPIIVAARVLEAAPSGRRTRHGDENSKLFGDAAKGFQEAMCELVRSIINPDAVQSAVKNPDTYKGKAIFAWRVMTDNCIDPSAYSRLFAASRPRERAAIEQMYRRMTRTLVVDFPLLGRDIIRTIVQDVQEYDRQEKLLGNKP